VAAAVLSPATDAAGGSSTGDELALAAEAAAGGADDVASAGMTSKAATRSSTSITRTSSTGLVFSGSGEAPDPGAAARPALAIIFCITSWRYLAAAGVWRIAGE